MTDSTFSNFDRFSKLISNQIILISANLSELIKLTYQIKKYLIKIKNLLFKESSSELHDLINSIIINNNRVFYSIITSFRKSNRFKFIESQRFSENGIVNRTTLLSNFRHFYQKSADYRQSTEYLNYINRQDCYRHFSKKIENVSFEKNSFKEIRFFIEYEDNLSIVFNVSKFSKFRSDNISFKIKFLRLILTNNSTIFSSDTEILFKVEIMSDSDAS